MRCKKLESTCCREQEISWAKNERDMRDKLKLTKEIVGKRELTRVSMETIDYYIT